MIQKFISKYGLATHLALLAAVPLAFAPFLSAAALGSVILWLTAFAAVWLFTEPSLRRGEHISTSRRRLYREMIADPFFWFALMGVIYAMVRWLNSGMSIAYNAEEAEWAVSPPSVEGLPASAGASGFLFFAVTLAVVVVALGLRNGVGRAARIEFGLAGFMVAGMGGLAAAICACAGVKQFVSASIAGFADEPFWASSFGVWLVVGVASAAAGEVERWVHARIPYLIGVVGNVAGLYFFAPSMVAAAWGAFALVVFLIGILFVKRNSTSGAMARYAIVVVAGAVVPIFMVMSFMDASFSETKYASLVNLPIALPESYHGMSEALSRISKEMWTSHPWFGVGLGAFPLHVPFIADKAEWALLPVRPEFAPNGYWTILAERGLTGCTVLAVGVGILVVSYVLRFIGGYRCFKNEDEVGAFVFYVPPVAWIAPVALILFAVEAFLSPIFGASPFLFALTMPLALAASSFPKMRARRSSETDGQHNDTASSEK